MASAPLNENPRVRPGSLHTLERDALDAKYGVEPYEPFVPLPKEKLDFVKLEAIDLGKYSDGSSQEDAESRQKLAEQLNHSLRTHGFFFITNHGISDEVFARVEAISRALHSLPEPEKLQYRSAGLRSDEDETTAGAERSGGFKPLKYWSAGPNAERDNISFYNFLHLVQDEAGLAQNHPEIARVYFNEVANYYRYIHHEVLRKLLVLCDTILELPEGTLFNRYFNVYQGELDRSGGGYGRFMVYYGPPEKDISDVAPNATSQDGPATPPSDHPLKSKHEAQNNSTWLRGHSDSGAFTFIRSNPIASLQIRNYDTGNWQWVPYVPGALVVNVGDAIEFLTGGYWRSTIHRVVNPPPSQQGLLRQSIIYFSKPSWQTVIDPEELGSPRLQRLGIRSQPSWERISYGQWDVEKGRSFGKSKLNNIPGDAPRPKYIHGRLAERWIPTLAS